ncbi:hypothetical protein [Vibrio panuliri]|uniref:Uncharacterized protein n=1 Tax=Vibrio panuliri TaxID=1381081 RepID=A0ABX3FU62_9VIBR|nr:hypothetical protein [Vibrio panuliri]KAB1459664.1 hypothetical protein F7O85_02895 [Vibrio panuliri]OLQ96547.1 hypothetical protein BIY20_18720 [Vibrio panuliri]
MKSYPATHFCQKCQSDTPHSELLERKPSSYDTDTSLLGRITLFAHTFINGGHYYDMNRYVQCKVCGQKELDNKGSEFE